MQQINDDKIFLLMHNINKGACACMLTKKPIMLNVH